MPLRKIEHPDLDVARDHLNTLWFNDNIKFITVSLQPFLYKESFKNQYTMAMKELHQFIECLTEVKAYVATEATQKNNVHFHILCYTDYDVDIIDDFVKNFKRLGNTLSKVVDEETFPKLKQYLLKDYDRTNKLLNLLKIKGELLEFDENNFKAPTFELEFYTRPKKIKKPLKKIVQILDKDEYDENDLIFMAKHGWTVNEDGIVLNNKPPKPAKTKTV